MSLGRNVPMATVSENADRVGYSIERARWSFGRQTGTYVRVGQDYDKLFAGIVHLVDTPRDGHSVDNFKIRASTILITRVSRVHVVELLYRVTCLHAMCTY